MKVVLLAVLCTLSLSASAQWWSLKKHKRSPILVQVQQQPFQIPAIKVDVPPISKVAIGQTAYNLTLNERIVMKTAQHQMRFREYENASYSFNELAKIYMQLNKNSEAKWFFLQSNNLSRQQQNDRLTIANLLELATVKCTIGDFALAQQDLEEARAMAVAHNWQNDLLLVNKRLELLQSTKLAALKPEGGLAATAHNTL